MNDATPTAPTSSVVSPARDRRVSPWWRALAIALMLVVLIGWAAASSMLTQLQAQIGHLQTRLVQVPQIRHVSVLLDAQGLPAMLATHNPQDGQLTLQRLNELKEGREDSMQVWALTDGAEPRSLGVVTSRYKTLQMPVASASLNGATQLGVSAENKGGVAPGSGPSLPWLFKGALVQKSI